MTIEPPCDDGPSTPATSYEAFLAADPRRRGDALEIGIDFTDQDDNRYRVCWYAETGELTIESIDLDALDLEDFHQGVTSVAIAARLDREELEDRLGAWPQVEHARPRTLSRLRELLDRRD